MRADVKEILFQLPQTSHGQALKIYLDEKFDLINDVHGIETLEEVKGRQIAIKLLEDIFNFYKGKPPVDVKGTQYV